MHNKIMFSKERIKKVLVSCRKSGIGDAVFSIPALKALKNFLPSAKFSLLYSSHCQFKDMVENQGIFDEYLSINEFKVLNLKLICELRKRNFDLLISDFHNNDIFTVLLVMYGVIPYRVGHVSNSPEWRWLNRWSWVYNLTAMIQSDMYAIDTYLQLIYAIGVDKDCINREIRINTSDEDKKFVEEFCKKRGFKEDEMLVGIHIGTSQGMEWKSWGLDKYVELCNRILQLPATRIILFGTARELDANKYLINRMIRQPVNAIGETTVKQAIELIKNCRIFINNDSGLGKIAIAVDTPTITIWGPSDWPRAKAWKPGHIDIVKKLECSPCYRYANKGAENCKLDYKCLCTISVEEVFLAVKKLLLKD